MLPSALRIRWQGVCTTMGLKFTGTTRVDVGAWDDQQRFLVFGEHGEFALMAYNPDADGGPECFGDEHGSADSDVDTDPPLDTDVALPAWTPLQADFVPGFLGGEQRVTGAAYLDSALLGVDTYGGAFVAVGTNGKIRIGELNAAHDHVDWTHPVTVADGDDTGSPSGPIGELKLTDVAPAGQHGFMAVGEDGVVVRTTSDVYHWTVLRPLDESAVVFFHAIARVGAANVLVGNDSTALLYRPWMDGELDETDDASIVGDGQWSVDPGAGAPTLTYGSGTLAGLNSAAPGFERIPIEPISGTELDVAPGTRLFDVVADEAILEKKRHGTDAPVAGQDMAFLIGGNGGYLARVVLPLHGNHLIGAARMWIEVAGSGRDWPSMPWGAEDVGSLWSDDRTRVVTTRAEDRAVGLLFTAPKEEDIDARVWWIDRTPNTDGSPLQVTGIAGNSVNYIMTGWVIDSEEHTVGGAVLGRNDVQSCVGEGAPYGDTDGGAYAVDTDFVGGCVGSSDTDDVEDFNVGSAHFMFGGDALTADTAVSESMDEGEPAVIHHDGTITTTYPAGTYGYLRVNVRDKRDPDDRRQWRVDFTSLPGVIGNMAKRKQNHPRWSLPDGAGRLDLSDDALTDEDPNGAWPVEEADFVDMFTGVGISHLDRAVSFRGMIVDAPDRCGGYSDPYEYWYMQATGIGHPTHAPNSYMRTVGVDIHADPPVSAVAADPFHHVWGSITRFRSGLSHDFTDDYESYKEGYEPRYESMRHEFAGACESPACTEETVGGAACMDVCCETDHPLGRFASLYAPFSGKLYAFHADQTPEAVSTTCNSPYESPYDLTVPSPWPGDASLADEVVLVSDEMNVAIEVHLVESCLSDGVPNSPTGIAVAAGDRIGRMTPWLGPVVAVWVNDEDDRWRAISYFDLLPDELYAIYREHFNLAPRRAEDDGLDAGDDRDPSIPLSDRDLCPLRPVPTSGTDTTWDETPLSCDAGCDSLIATEQILSPDFSDSSPARCHP